MERCSCIWNLELIDVSPENKGYGTIFLQEVLKRENLEPREMTAGGIDDRAIFFKKKRISDINYLHTLVNIFFLIFNILNI